MCGSLDGLCFPVINSKIARPLVRREPGKLNSSAATNGIALDYNEL
jgi:hypothetical protein